MKKEKETRKGNRSYPSGLCEPGFREGGEHSFIGQKKEGVVGGEGEQFKRERVQTGRDRSLTPGKCSRRRQIDLPRRDGKGKRMEEPGASALLGGKTVVYCNGETPWIAIERSNYIEKKEKVSSDILGDARHMERRRKGGK